MSHPLIRPGIAKLTSYATTEYPSDAIHLDNMENPYNLIKPALLSECLHKVSSNRYPDAKQTELRQTVANYFQINADGLLFGNGSDELIQLITLAIGDSGSKVLSLYPGFSVYRLVAIACNRQFIDVPLQQDFSLDFNATLDAIKQHQPSILFIAYPNNPTGNLFGRQQLEEIIHQNSGITVIDEAYFAFANDSFLQNVQQFEKLIVMRTFSKVGFAGLRLGFIYAQPNWITEINKVRLPYNINSLSQTIITTVLKNAKLFEQSIIKICQQRQIVLEALNTFSSLESFNSHANFILFRPRNPQQRHTLANHIHQQLLIQKIYIRNLSQENGLLQGCLRVSIGTHAENQLFLKILKQIIKYSIKNPPYNYIIQSYERN